MRLADSPILIIENWGETNQNRETEYVWLIWLHMSLVSFSTLENVDVDKGEGVPRFRTTADKGVQNLGKMV